MCRPGEGSPCCHVHPQVCSGLQVTTAQALPLALHANCDGWAQEQVEHILKPLQAGVPPLSSAAFEVGMQGTASDGPGYAAHSP